MRPRTRRSGRGAKSGAARTVGDSLRILLAPTVRQGNALLVSAQGLFAGGEILQTTDGESFEPITLPGFGAPDNFAVQALGAFQGRLLAETTNSFTGGELWSCGGDVAASWRALESMATTMHPLRRHASRCSPMGSVAFG